MNYEYKISKTAMKFIRRQDKKQQERLLKAIYALPFGGDVRKMSGTDNTYRLRVGDFCILYRLTTKGLEITLIEIFDADNRGQVYK